MPQRVYEGSLCHKKWDADRSSLGSLAKLVGEDAEAKITKATTDKKSHGFKVLARSRGAVASKARDIRHTL